MRTLDHLPNARLSAISEALLFQTVVYVVPRSLGDWEIRYERLRPFDRPVLRVTPDGVVQEVCSEIAVCDM